MNFTKGERFMKDAVMAGVVLLSIFALGFIAGALIF
jgi:hypothetical protein